MTSTVWIAWPWYLSVWLLKTNVGILANSELRLQCSYDLVGAVQDIDLVVVSFNLQTAQVLEVPRDAYARSCGGWLSVCVLLSVCSCIILETAKHIVKLFSPSDGRPTISFCMKYYREISTGFPFTGASNADVIWKKSQFSTSISLYLGNYTRYGHRYRGTPIWTCSLCDLSNGTIFNVLEWTLTRRESYFFNPTDRLVTVYVGHPFTRHIHQSNLANCVTTRSIYDSWASCLPSLMIVAVHRRRWKYRIEEWRFMLFSFFIFINKLCF